jgi:hypothetical protein
MTESASYHESPVPGGRMSCLLGVVIGVMAIGLAFATGSVILGVFGAMATFFSVVALSTFRYSAIDLQDRELRVGRDRIDVGALDTDYGVRTGSDEFDDATRSSLEIGVSSERGDVRILGGAWGRTMNGSQWVVVRETAGGKRHAVATRFPDRFTQALRQAMADR